MSQRFFTPFFRRIATGRELTLAALLLAFPLSAWAASGAGGFAPLTQSQFSEVVGEVFVTPTSDSTTHQPVVSGTPFVASGILHTGPHSHVQLTAPGGTLARLGSNTVFSVDPSGAIHLLSGSLLVSSPAGGSGGTLITPSTTATFSGSTMIISAAPGGGFKLLNLAGTASMQVAGGQTVSLNAGQMSFVLPGTRGGSLGPVLNFDLKKLSQGSALVNGFAVALPSLGLVSDATQQQQQKIQAGQFTETNQVILGAVSPEKVMLAEAYASNIQPQSNYQPLTVDYNTIHGDLAALYALSTQPDLVLGPHLGQTLPAYNIFVSPGQTFTASQLNLPAGFLPHDQLTATGLIGTHLQASGLVDLSALDGQKEVDILAKDIFTISLPTSSSQGGSGSSSSGGSAGNYTGGVLDNFSGGSSLSVDSGVTTLAGLPIRSISSLGGIFANGASGNLILSDNNTFGGIVIINANSQNLTFGSSGNSGNLTIGNGGTLNFNSSNITNSTITLNSGGALILNSNTHIANETVNLNSGATLTINAPTALTATNGSLTLNSGGVQTTINQGDTLTVDSGIITSNSNASTFTLNSVVSLSLFTASLQSSTTSTSSNSSASGTKKTSIDQATDLVFIGLSSTLKLNLIADNGFDFQSGGMTIQADFLPTLFPALPIPGNNLDESATPTIIFATEFGLMDLAGTGTQGDFNLPFLGTIQNPTGDLKLQSYLGNVTSVGVTLNGGRNTSVQSADGTVTLSSTNITTGANGTLTVSSGFIPTNTGGSGVVTGVVLVDSPFPIANLTALFASPTGVIINSASYTVTNATTNITTTAVGSILQTGSAGSYNGKLNIISSTNINISDSTLYSSVQNIIAESNLTISNTSINPGTLPAGSKFIYAGGTVALNDIDFPAGSTVDLYSPIGVLNTNGTILSGEVNFLSNVTYNGTSTDSLIGTTIQIGLMSNNGTVQSALATSLTFDGAITNLPSANLFDNVLFSPAALGDAPFDVNFFQVHGLIAGNLTLGGSIDLTSLPSDSIMLALAATNITIDGDTVLNPPTTPGLRLIAFGNFTLPSGLSLSVNFPTSGSSFEFESLHDFDFEQTNLANANGTILVNSLEGNLTFNGSTVTAGNDTYAGLVLLNAASDYSTILINNSTLTANTTALINAANITTVNSTITGGNNVILTASVADLNVSDSNLTTSATNGQIGLVANGNISVTNSTLTAQTSPVTSPTINFAAAHVVTVQDSALVGAYSNVQAADLAVLNNVDVGSAQAISIAARTINLSNINFPNGSFVYLSSQNGQLARNPNTGAASVVGDVNFITHVLYNGLPAQNFVSPSVGGSGSSGTNPIQIGALPRVNSHP